MRNLNSLPVSEDIKIELANAALLLQQKQGIKVDILEFDEKVLILRIIQIRCTDGKFYTNRELAIIGKEVIMPLEPFFEACHIRPLVLLPK